MNILFLSGALPDTSADLAAGTLPEALRALGHDVRVAVPLLAPSLRAPAARPGPRLGVPHVRGMVPVRVSIVVVSGGMPGYVLAGPARRRGRDDPATWVLFALGALALCRALEWVPDIIHVEALAAGAALYWLDTDGAHDPAFRRTAGVAAARDLHGAAAVDAAAALLAHGLVPSDSPRLPDDQARAQLGALALAHANLIAASASAAAPGVPLARLLAARPDALRQLPAGLDSARWNAQRDRLLAARFGPARLERRARNKQAVQQAVGLPEQPTVPLVAWVPLAPAARGADLVPPALRRLLADRARRAVPAQVAILGDAPPPLRAELRALAHAHRAGLAWQPRPGPALVHALLGGADVVIDPAPPGEPAQVALLAQRYGALPVAFAAGASTGPNSDFSFREYNPQELHAAVERALSEHHRARSWRARQKWGMEQSARHAWPVVAWACQALYRAAIQRRKEAVDQP